MSEDEAYRYGTWPPEVDEEVLVWMVNGDGWQPAMLRPDNVWRLGPGWYVQALPGDRWRYDR